MNISSFGRNVKRKRNSSVISDNQRQHKKLRINGSSLTESSSHLPNSANNHLSHLITSTKLEKNEDKITHNKYIKKKHELETLNRKNLMSSKTFDKSKFKIRLSPKNKSDKKKVTNNNESKKRPDKLHSQMIGPKTVENKYGTSTYYLKFKREKAISEGRLNYQFQKLVTDVKNMNLPSPTWKIKVIIKQNKISAITFTNKQELERSVTFSSEIDKYKLQIHSKPAVLLGSPQTIETPEDIEILLDIVETIDSSSPIILYR